MATNPYIHQVESYERQLLQKRQAYNRATSDSAKRAMQGQIDSLERNLLLNRQRMEKWEREH